MKFFTIQNSFQYFLPVTLTIFMLVTMERTVVTDGGYDRLFGFPVPFISNNYGYSFDFDVYIFPLLVDFIVCVILTLVVFTALTTIGMKFKTHWALLLLGITICLFWTVLFILNTQTSSFKLTNNIQFKTSSKHFYLGTFP